MMVDRAAFTVGTWPTAGAPAGGLDSLTVTAPAGVTLASDACLTYSVFFVLPPPDAEKHVTVTFDPTCGASGSVDITLIFAS